MDSSLRPQPNWQGAHHLALVTRDLDATVRFYHELVGMTLLAAMGPMPYHGRHCFLRAGHFLLHFFEQPDAKIAVPAPGWELNRIAFVAGAFQHLALALDDEASLLALRERLVAAGVTVTEFMSQGPIRQFLFVDNNGIILEVNWAPFDFIAQPVDYGNRQAFSDPDPVPAVREIMQEGHARLQRP